MQIIGPGEYYAASPALGNAHAGGFTVPASRVHPRQG